MSNFFWSKVLVVTTRNMGVVVAISQKVVATASSLKVFGDALVVTYTCNDKSSPKRFNVVAVTSLEIPIDDYYDDDKFKKIIANTIFFIN